MAISTHAEGLAVRWGTSIPLLLGASALACATLSPAVSVNDSCVSEHGYSCDWYAALELAETGACVEELRQHWSLAVRDACAGQADGEVDIDIRLGNNDVHFASRPPSQGRGGVPPAIDERLAREFLFPKSGSYPQLDDRHDVTVLTSTRLGVLVGIYKGEWGGGLIYLPRRGEAQLLVREPVRNIFELGGRVYVIGGDYLHRSELYELTRRGRSQAWELRLRFRLPGWLLETRKTDDEVVLVTDGGTVTLHATGIIEVSP